METEALNAEAAMRKRVVLTVTLVISSFGTSQADEATWDNAIKSGDDFLRSSRYSQAEQSYRAAVREAKKFGNKDSRLAQSLSKLAGLYRDQDRYTEAMALCQRALTIWETTLGPDHPYVAAGLNNVANLYVNQGFFGEAHMAPLVADDVT
jgi:tetratricopeptide (TPR) repeat protein